MSGSSLEQCDDCKDWVTTLSATKKGYLCSDCENKLDFKDTWECLGDIPVNEDGEIEEAFLHFPIGTDREEIWHWIEKEYNIVLGNYMYQSDEAGRPKPEKESIMKRIMKRITRESTWDYDVSGTDGYVNTQTVKTVETWEYSEELNRYELVNLAEKENGEYIPFNEADYIRDGAVDIPTK